MILLQDTLNIIAKGDIPCRDFPKRADDSLVIAADRWLRTSLELTIAMRREMDERELVFYFAQAVFYGYSRHRASLLWVSFKV